MSNPVYRFGVDRLAAIQTNPASYTTHMPGNIFG